MSDDRIRPLPSNYRKMTEQERLPIGERLFKLLRVWFLHSPNSMSGSSDRPICDFLKWLIADRVMDVLRHLDVSSDPMDRNVASKLRWLGQKTCPRGPYPAQPMSYALWGWLGTEMGNPTWRPEPRRVYVALPTDPYIETYARILHARIEKMDYFPNGVMLLDGLTDEQLEHFHCLVYERPVRNRKLWRDALLIHRLDEPQPTFPPLPDNLKKLQEESDSIMNKMLAELSKNYQAPKLDDEILQLIEAEMTRHTKKRMDKYSPIPFDAFPGSDPDPEVMESMRKEVVAERAARSGGGNGTEASQKQKGYGMFKLKWNEPIDLYYAGDSIGAVAEGAAGGKVSFEKAITGLQAFPNGTDEADTARLFFRYCAEIGMDNFDVLDWYAYHAHHRAAVMYGKTWRDHFNTVNYILKNKGRLDYDQLLQISKDRNSNGNGCLALAYPIAKLFPDRAQEVAEKITAATHIMALPTMQIAVAFFLREKSLDDVIAESFPQHRDDLWDLTPISHACLCAAAIIAKEKTIEEAIRLALAKGGDVDSYLSLGLLMWGVAHHS